MRRYTTDTKLGQTKYGTTRTIGIVRTLINRGEVATKRFIVGDQMRLDHIAEKEYGDATLWWVIAAASGIGWGLQVPANTMITIPIQIDKIKRAL